MKKLALVLALALAPQATACSGTQAPQATAEEALRAEQTYTQMVGRWQFVYDDARKAAYEAELAKKIDDPAKLEEAKKEATLEAAQSTVELTADHRYRSFIGDEEIFQAKCTNMRPAAEPRSVECTPDSFVQRIAAGNPMVRLESDDVLVMRDPKKGDLRFRRIH